MTDGNKIALASAIISVISIFFTIYFARKASKASEKSLVYAKEANSYANNANTYSSDANTHAKNANTYSSDANTHAKNANNIAIGQMETSLREQISIARNRMEDQALKIPEFLKVRKPKELDEHDKRYLDFLDTTWKSSNENYLNAYEDACGKFNDGKIDKGRFRKVYINEIKNLCDDKKESFSRLMHPKATSQFEAIWKVFDEWHRHE